MYQHRTIDELILTVLVFTYSIHFPFICYTHLHIWCELLKLKFPSYRMYRVVDHSWLFVYYPSQQLLQTFWNIEQFNEFTCNTNVAWKKKNNKSYKNKAAYHSSTSLKIAKLFNHYSVVHFSVRHTSSDPSSRCVFFLMCDRGRFTISILSYELIAV